MEPAEIRRNLGLPEDATDEQVQERFALARGEQPEAPAAEEAAAEETPAGEQVPSAASAAAADTVTLDRAAYEQLRSGAQDGAAARAAQLATDRDRIVNEAVASGRIPPARRDHWRAALDADPEGAAASLASLAEGLIPLTERGGAPSTDVAEDEQLAAARASFGITRKGA